MGTMDYFRPLVMSNAPKPAKGFTLVGSWLWFDQCVHLRRDRAPQIIAAKDLPPLVLKRLTAPRPSLVGLVFDRPQVMGVLNVTPDSFSDGGQFDRLPQALDHARRLRAEGADLLDIGGESTRPGAVTVDAELESGRTAPVIKALRKAGEDCPLSIDTRKAAVASVALAAGASILNDVSALQFDKALADVASMSGAPICLMHALGTPITMQNDPFYDNVLLDVYDFLENAIHRAEACGIDRANIIIDPGIGFGKTLNHNLALLKDLALFHALGCPILLGASRKHFVGTLTQTSQADERVHGSVAVALTAVAQGVQIIRVHDVAATVQAIAVWQAVHKGTFSSRGEK
ncbi:MAG: dihydropteroate synthase [Paracoccaceae bacterium]|jgi:dihydropteroate synthase